MRIFLHFLILAFLVINRAHAQEAGLDSLKLIVNQSFGIEKLKNINRLFTRYEHSEEKDRFKYGKQGVIMAENLIEARDQSIHTDLKAYVEAFYYGGKNDYFKSWINPHKGKLAMILKGLA